MIRFFRTRVLPWVVWSSTMTAAVWLWLDLRSGGAVGFVPSVEYTVAPRELGRVESVAVVVGQQVRAGTVLARLDESALAAEAEVLAAERRQISAQLGAVRSETEGRQSDTRRELDQSVEAAELTMQSIRAARGAKAAELAALSTQVESMRALVEQRMADRRELDALTVKQSALKSEVEGTGSLLTQLLGQIAAARSRRGAVPGDATVLATEPLRAELEVLERREQELALRRRELVLRAPADGQIATVLARPGDVVMAGAPVVTLVGAGVGPGSVEVCLGEAQAGRVRLGEAALLYPRGVAGVELAGHVTVLGPQVAELPLRCRRDPQIPEWGRQVTVTLDQAAPLLAGQSFSVAFQGRVSALAAGPLAAGPSEPSEPTPTPTPVAATPTAIVVPAELAARTRVEPSGLAWSPRRDRFVVASDDTGFADRDEHAPWLLTMDRGGALDPAPLVIAGLDAVSDLEAVTAGPEDSFYLLASQSRSRKGKRSPARQVFARVVIDAAGARVAEVTRLVAQLDAADASVRAGLGITDTAQLDIEGMTPAPEGGLLLGLKAPLSASGAAIVWRVGRPERLLAGAGPAAAELSLWGTVPLQVRADGAEVAGGISELLALADGSLLIAGTASGTEPAQQSGALWHAAGKAGLAAPRRVREFAGLKPEGLAMAADGAALVVVFDTGEQAPLWMELPWPER